MQGRDVIQDEVAKHAAQARPLVMLNEHRAKKLVVAQGLRAPKSIMLTDAKDLAGIGDLAAPYAVKIVSPDVIHKSDGGFVAINLMDMCAVSDEISDMEKRASAKGFRIDGFLVEEMAPAGIELTVGGFRDASFGPMIMFGLGGVYVEVFKDVAFRICPIDRVDVEEMLEELICEPILRGARGKQGVDIESLVEFLMLIGGENGIMMNESIGIEEMDLNPVIASGDGLWVVDARVKLPGGFADE